MEMIAAVPEWLVWCTAGMAGAFALTVLASTIEAALDLET